MRKKALCRVAVAAAAIAIIFALAACLPSGLHDGWQEDPRDFSEYPEYAAAIYQKDGLALPYRLYSPSPVESGKKYPLLVFLHGSGENGVDNKNQFYPVFVEKMREYQEEFGGFYIMLPQAKNKVAWDYYLKQDAGNVLSAAIEDLLSRENAIDDARLYCSGLSLGGFGTISELRLEPDRFAAAFSICGGDSGYWYDDSYSPAPSVYEAIARTPLLLAHGTKDPTVPFSYSREIYDGVTKAGGKVRFEPLEDMEHNIWNRCFETKAYWEWLFSHSKAAE